MKLQNLKLWGGNLQLVINIKEIEKPIWIHGWMDGLLDIDRCMVMYIIIYIYTHFEIDMNIVGNTVQETANTGRMQSKLQQKL